MIDTIILRLHGLKNYTATVNILHKKKKTSSTQFFMNKETLESLEALKNLDIHAVLYHNSNHIEFVNHRSSIKLPSSHYELACCINYKQDFIEFNFSIPKYRFGSNLFQFIDYYSQTVERQFQILMEFIQRFKGNFIDPISDCDLEINRIDFCYNQFFNSEEEALKYMEIQEKAFEKNARSAGAFKKYGRETLMLVTNRYSFKVYHKGPEFRKHDYPKLSENNYKAFDLKVMQQIADRILRYECSFRSSYLFYQWLQLNIVQKKKPVDGVYRYLFKALKIQSYDHVQNIEAKKFFIKSRYDNWRQYKDRDGVNWPKNFVHDHAVTFNYELFERLYNEFWKHVRSVQIKTSSNVSVHILKKRIEQYNREENVKIALSTSKKAKFKNVNRLMFYFDISQRGSLKNYMKKGMMSQRTYQRIIKVFKRLNLADYNPVVNLATPSLGYQDYKHYFGSFVC